MFIIISIYVKEKEIRFSNTCNAFHNYSSNLDTKLLKENENFNKLAVEAYKSPNKIPLSETDYGFTEELVLYKDYLFCFVCSGSYKLLFNYLPAKDLFIYNNFPNITKYQIEKIHEPSPADVIGNIKITLYNGITVNYSVICSYEAFLDYIKYNSLGENFNKFIFNSFLETLTASKINTSNLNPNYGLTATKIDSQHMFNYLYFDKLIIITNYKKLS